MFGGIVSANISKNSAWRSVYEHDYYGRKQQAKTEATYTLPEQSKTDSPNNIQIEIKNCDTMNDNSFGQLKYSSNAVQDISSKSITEFGGIKLMMFVVLYDYY